MITLSVAPTGTNDTANLQAALNSIRSALGGTLVLEGAYSTNSLNAQNITGLTIDCKAGTQVTAAMVGAGPMMDLLNSHVVRVNGGLWLGTSGAQAAFLAGGGDQYVFDNVRASGTYTAGALVLIGAHSVTVRDGQWMNYHGVAPALTISNQADWGIASKFSSLPPTSRTPSNLHFIATEFHGMGYQAFTTYMRNAHSVTFVGGNHDNSGTAHMLFQGSSSQITSIGQSFYSELGTPAAVVFTADALATCEHLKVLNAVHSGIGSITGGAGYFPNLWVQ